MPENSEEMRRSRGRPRAFDRTEVVDRAMRLFWARGYEGASLDELMTTMEISPSSFYSAFGSKQKLYHEVLDHYCQGPGSYFEEVMAAYEDTRTALAEAFKRAAEACTSGAFPSGCMISLSNIYVGPELYDLRDELRSRRNELALKLSRRLSWALEAGQLPPDTDIEDLAIFFAACFRGMTVLSVDGAPREKLQAIGRMAMRAWPEPQDPSGD
jgi:AcrR family transcriptional regulator